MFTVREDTLAGFQSLFEFILDLAGFQHIDIKKIYPYIDVNFETVVELLAGQLSERQKVRLSSPIKDFIVFTDGKLILG